MYLRSFFILIVTVFHFTATKIPSFITPCKKDQSPEDFNTCILQQARNALPYFVQGVPEFHLDPIDPLSIDNFDVKTGSLGIKHKNIILNGLRGMEFRDLKWDLQKMTGNLRVFGNLTMISDYEIDGRIIEIPITGKGKLTVRMDNTEIIMKYKLKNVRGDDGVEHLSSYDLKAKQTYQNVHFKLISDMGENVLTNIVTRVMNDNWREFMEELGPPHIKAISARVSHVINTLYAQVPATELIP